MIYKWGGDFMGDNFLRREFSLGAIFSGTNFWVVIFTGGSFHSVKYS